MSNVLYGLDADATSSTNDLIIAKSIAEGLNAHYPGHLWAVSADGQTGLVTIRNLYLSGEWGYVLKLPDVYSASSLLKDAIIGAGELLERYKLRRGSFSETEYAALPTNFAGHLTFDK